jgi:hypothetical protein
VLEIEVGVADFDHHASTRSTVARSNDAPRR